MPSSRRPRALKRFLIVCGPVFLALALGLAPAMAKKVPLPRARPGTRAAAPPADGVTDLSHAMPLKALSRLPSTADQFRALRSEIAKDKPRVDTAKSASDALALQAAALQRRLVDTATRVELLEQQKLRLDAEIVRLAAQNDTMTASFARDRVAVSHLLAIIERLQHDTPPAMVLRPDDVLSTARGAMLVGASLPEVYGAAAQLASRIELLRRTRVALVQERAAAAANAAALSQARVELDQLLATKRLEADAAATRYGDLKQRFDTIAAKAVNLEALLAKVAVLRNAPPNRSVVTVTAEKPAAARELARDSLIAPVAGMMAPGGLDGVGGSAAPGVSYTTPVSARVVSPADGRVLYAGPYHKSGLVLILQMSGGYDALLAGLDRLDVRPEDCVLAGEPVGTMSKSNPQPRLYFELRQNGRGMSPAPYLAPVLRKIK